MSHEPYLTATRIFTDPGMRLLAVLLAMSALIFAWWPTDLYLADVSLVAWMMFATLPVSIALTGIYVLWMEQRDTRAEDSTSSRDPA